jgi:hypothetical protein
MAVPLRKQFLKECLLHGALLLLILFAAFPGFFLRGESAFPGDLLYGCSPWKLHAPAGMEHARNPFLCDMSSAFMPWCQLTRESLRHGEWPLWNPYQFAGAPLLANWQSAIFYPPSLLRSFGDIYVGFTLYVLLKLWLCGMTAYWCARGIGLGRGAATFMSFGWMLCGYSFVWSYWPITDVCAWAPVIFLGTEWTLNGRLRRGFFATLFGAVLALLAGHPESLFILAIGFAIYAALRLVIERRKIRDFASFGVIWGFAWAVALLVCAAQILPFLEYLANSAPPSSKSNMGASPGLPIRAVMCLWIPRFFGSPIESNYWGDMDTNRFLMGYAGVPVWLAAGLAFLRSPSDRRPRSRAMALSLLIAATAFFLLAFDAPPFDALNRLPVFHMLKRTYYVAFPMFALPLLGALGVENWFSMQRRPRDLVVCLLIAAAINATVCFTIHFYGGVIRLTHFTDYLLGQLSLFWIAQGAFFAILLGSFLKPKARAYPALLAAVLAADLLVAGRGVNPTTSRSVMYPETDLTQYLRSLPGPCRVGLAEGMIHTGFMTPYGIQEIYGYDALYPGRITRFQQALKADVWKSAEPLYNIAYYLNDPEMSSKALTPGPKFPLEKPGRFTFVDKLDGVEIYKNNGALPRAYLINRARVIPDFTTMMDAMRDPNFNPGVETLIEQPLKNPLPDAPSEKPGTARINKYGSLGVTVEANANTESILVLADAYFPGWRAKLDGVETEIFPICGVFRGIRVPAGNHHVEFFYSPMSLKAGIGISLTALLISIAASTAILARRRRSAIIRSEGRR